MALNVFSNGLRLVCLPKVDKKVVCVVLYVAGGTQSEKNYQSGISDYLTKMLLMGTKKHSSKAILMNYAKSYGIILTPHNSKESITISAVCPKENVEVAIRLLSEIAFDSNFSVEDGDAIRKAQMNTVSYLSENPQYVMDKLLNSTLYYRTGLANPKQGTSITVSRFRALDAKDFYEKIFTPRNTIISVVGDVDQTSIYNEVKSSFFDRMKNDEEEKVYKKLKYVSTIDNFKGSSKGRIKRLNQTRIEIAFPTFSFKDKEKYLIEISKPIIENHIRQSLSNLNYYFNTKINSKYYSNNGNIVFDIVVDYEFAEEHLYNFVRALNDDVKHRDITAEEFEIEKRVFVTKFMDKYDNALENALISARTLALTKQTFSEGSERLKIEVMTNKDANKLLSNILDFNKMVVVYVGHDIDVDYEDLISEVQ